MENAGKRGSLAREKMPEKVGFLGEKKGRVILEFPKEQIRGIPEKNGNFGKGKNPRKGRFWGMTSERSQEQIPGKKMGILGKE